MKKRILIIISAIILSAAGLSVYGLNLGGYQSGPHTEWWEVDGFVFLASTVCWDFGTTTTFSNGWPPITYYYGEEDLENFCKINIETSANNEAISFDKNVYIYVYEANDIVNPTPKKHEILRGDVAKNPQTLNLNLDKGKLYILLYRDEKGSVLDVKKIMISN